MRAKQLEEPPNAQPQRYQQLEEAVTAALASDDLKSATRLCVETLGREVFGFLAAYCRDSTLGSDAFAEFAVDLWRGLPTFAGRGGLRAWAYVVARHAGDRVLRAQTRAAQRNVSLDQAPELFELVEWVRQTTRSYLGTEVKQRFRELISKLPEEDQVLLQLRLYSPEKLGWIEIARVVGNGDEQDVAREAARLRKHYERLLARIREAAKTSGLLERT